MSDFFLDEVVKQVRGGSVIKGAYPVYCVTVSTIPNLFGVRALRLILIRLILMKLIFYETYFEETHFDEIDFYETHFEETPFDETHFDLTLIFM